MAIAGIAIILCVLGVLWYGSKHGSISLGHYGFSHGWGMWVNVGLILGVTALVAGRVDPIRLPTEGSSVVMILGAFTEEIVFRVYLIRILSTLLSPRKGHVVRAVLLSAGLFTAMHLFRQPASMLLGLFLTSVILGYVTYRTKSVLLASYSHVVANTAQVLGLLGGGVSIAAYLAISLFSSLRRSHSMKLLDPPTGSL